ncbi:MAG TPA: hypothetical protein PLG47_04090 [Candidatus Dojkabacteria bacterium]|nr:hypothetical protein [Candidatus Dojkabacteria bacterium]
MDLLYLVLIIGGLIGTWIVLDLKFGWTSKNKDSKVRIILFEKIGNDIQRKKEVIKSVSFDDQLGYFIKLNKKNAISINDPRDLFYDSKVERCLELVKYGPDDYRVFSRMDKGTWFKLQEQEVLKKDENGEPIPLKDEDGKIMKDPESGEIIYETQIEQVPIPYEEPKGVTQTAREGIRFNRQFQKRMDELRKENKGWWAEHGIQVLSVGVIIIFMIFTTHNQQNYYKAVKEYTKTQADEMSAATEAINQPHWAENLIESVQRKENEKNTPLT